MQALCLLGAYLHEKPEKMAAEIPRMLKMRNKLGYFGPEYGPDKTRGVTIGSTSASAKRKRQEDLTRCVNGGRWQQDRWRRCADPLARRRQRRNWRA